MKNKKKINIIAIAMIVALIGCSVAVYAESSGPTIETSAVDSETNERISYPDDDVTIVDTVTYNNLIAGKEYVVEGILMDKETRQALTVNGNQVTARASFVPQQTSGTVEVVFNFDGRGLEGKDLVVFETLMDGNDVVASHQDLTDERQTIHLSVIRTNAVDSATGDKISNADSQVTIVDTVTYNTLIVGEEYTVNGILMDKITGDPILVNGSQVTATTTFTPENTSGTVDVTFNFDGRGLEGKDLVVFETLRDGTNVIARHQDLTDERQTIHFPKIHITVSDIISGSNMGTPNVEKKIIGTMAYSNFMAGKEYTVKAELVNKLTGQPTGSTSEATFTADAASGTIDVEFTFEVATNNNAVYVAFERVYLGNEEVAYYTDLEDETQTITINATGGIIVPDNNNISDNHVGNATIKTGDTNDIAVYVIISVIALVLLGLVAGYKKR